MAGRIAVVDEHNRFLFWEERRAVHVRRLVHRSVHVLVLDARGRLVVQRRHRDKQTHPSAWDVSCCGHVEESDYPAGPDDDLDAVYLATARRELKEELGVDADLTLVERVPPVAGVHYEQIHLFLARSDGPFVPQPEEVEEVRRLTPAEYEALLASGDKVTPILPFFVGLARARGLWGVA